MSDTKTALLTLGRLPKALDIARAFKCAGWRVIIAEPFAWHLCRPSRDVDKCYKTPAPNIDKSAYINALLDIIKTEEVTLIVPVSEENLHVLDLESLLPKGVRIFGSDKKLVQQCFDKATFIEKAKNLHLSVPETAILGTPEAEALSTEMDYIIKPIESCSGLRIEFGAQNDALPLQIERPPSVVQQRLNGRHKSSFSLCDNGRVLGTIIYHGLVYSGTVSVAFKRLDFEPEIEQWVTSFAQATGYSGFLSFDFIEDAHGVPHAIECNPRATSGIHFLTKHALADAMLYPDQLGGEGFSDAQLKPHKALQQFFPTLTEVQATGRKGEGFKEKFYWLRKAKDVSFEWRDPLPLWLMSFTSANIIYGSIKEKIPMAEISMRDIAHGFEGQPKP